MKLVAKTPLALSADQRELVTVLTKRLRPSQSYDVQDHPIQVFNRAIERSVARALCQSLTRAPFWRVERSSAKETFHRHWSNTFPMTSALNLPLYAPSLVAVARMAGVAPERIAPIRAYCNLLNHGDAPHSHTDANKPSEVYTALWYICDRWQPDWGGETLFFDSGGDAKVAVSPRPGRLVVFDGAVLHVGRPPERLCHHPRLTVAYKFSLARAASGRRSRTLKHVSPTGPSTAGTRFFNADANVV